MEILTIAAMTIGLTLVFEFVNGFHDSANSIATVVATKVLSPVKAVVWAAVFNFAGIYLSQEVARTIGKGIIDQDLIYTEGALLLLCAVTGAIVWDLITWWFAIPTSSSHALVGGLIGAGVASVAGLSAIVWEGTLRTILFIVVSPAAGMIAAFLITVGVMRLLKRVSKTTVNKWFRHLQLGSSAFYSFGHGSNDAQKGMGIITMVLLIESGGSADTFNVEDWVMIVCGVAISLGTFFGGWRIVRTMATRITKLEPYQGFSAETGAAAMLFFTAHYGIPVSTTHTISGGIMGVGATRRLSAVRWGVGRKIALAWVVTIPAAATISGALFVLLNLLGL
jgi:PiT family inorganic phosphate transporter